jgi:hypothetical protein
VTPEYIKIPNLSDIELHIVQAAQKAAWHMQAFGITLKQAVPGGPEAKPHVPTAHDLESYLTQLVVDAHSGYLLAKHDASVHGVVPMSGQTIPDWDIEGYPDYEDPMFDVVVTGAYGRPGLIAVRIWLRLL